MKVDKTVTLNESEFKTALINYLMFRKELVCGNHEIPFNDISLQFMNGSVPETRPDHMTSIKITLKNYKQ